MLQQHGDVVIETDAASTRAVIQRSRQTWKSAALNAVALACAVAWLWIQVHDRGSLIALVAMAAGVAARILAARWQRQDTAPRPTAAPDRRTLAVLRAAEIGQVAVLTGAVIWMGFKEQANLFWPATAFLLLFGVGSAALINRGYGRLIDRINGERAG